MHIYLAFTLFALIILGYWIISELFTMLFRFTGLPDEKARFQVISLLTVMKSWPTISSRVGRL